MSSTKKKKSDSTETVTVPVSIRTSRFAPTPPPTWLAHMQPLLQTNTPSAAALREERAKANINQGETKDTVRKPVIPPDGETKSTPLSHDQKKNIRQKMSPYDDPRPPPALYDGKGFGDVTGMGEQHSNISFQPFHINIGKGKPGQQLRIPLDSVDSSVRQQEGPKPYVVRTAVGHGHPDFAVGDGGEQMMRTMLPTRILHGSQTQSYQKLNQHSLNVDDLTPGQKYLIVMNQHASKGFEGDFGGPYEHEHKKLLDHVQECNSMAVGNFQGKSTWDEFVKRVNVVEGQGDGFSSSRAGKSHQEYIDNTAHKIIPNIEAKIRTETSKGYKKDVDKILQLNKELYEIKGQLAEAKKIKPWTHYEIKEKKILAGLKKGRLKRALSHITPPFSHLASFPLGTIPSPHPDNIAPDTLVARFSCIQDIIEPDLPWGHQRLISSMVEEMKPDYAYFPANGVRQTNGHTEWLFKFYPLKDEIRNIKDRKAAALEFLRTGEGEGTISTTGCGSIPLMIKKNLSGKGMEGLRKGGVCKSPHQIATLITSYLGGRKKTRRKSHKKKRKKTRRKSHKKTRRKSHKKKRTTRKKKIKRK
jgi:hypothetical protein